MAEAPRLTIRTLRPSPGTASRSTLASGKSGMIRPRRSISETSSAACFGCGLFTTFASSSSMISSMLPTGTTKRCFAHSNEKASTIDSESGTRRMKLLPRPSSL